MKRPFIIWIISFGLILNASYMAYSNIKAVDILISPFAWVAISLIGAYGIFALKKWSQFFIVILSFISIAVWFDGILQAYRTGWPYSDITSTIISLIPGSFLVLWWVGISVFTVRLFNKYPKA